MPPVDDQLERNVLGCILSGADIPSILDAGMFASLRNRTVFKALSAMTEQGNAPDLVTLSHYLQSIGKLEEVGGAAYVASLTDGVFPSQIEYLTETLVRRCRDRKYETAIKLAAESIGREPTDWIVRDLQTKLEAQAPEPGGGFRFERVGGMEVKASSWLVQGLLETDSFSCLFGDPGAGKSFLAIELAACVATGTSFHGFKVKHPGPVIYIAGEGRTGLVRRFRAWSIAMRVPLADAPLFLNSGAVSLIDDGSIVSVVKALKVLVKELGRPPALAILDTWSRTLGGDDSAPSDGASGVAALDSFRARFDNFATLVVHHEGHTKGRARGWSGLHAAVDTEFRAVRGNDDLLRLECTKSKDTRPVDPMAFLFAGVDLGITDEEGNPFTSAVLNTVDWTPVPEAADKKPVGKNQALALDILKRLSAGNDPVTLDAWREACKSVGMERTALWHVIDSLKKNGLIQADGEIVCCKGVALNVETGGLLYSPPVSTHVSTPYTRVENPTVSTDFNTFNGFNGQPGIPDGIAPGEYRECYNTAYSVFISKGLSPDEADRKAREEIKKFVAGYNPPGSGAVVSPPPLTTPDEEIDF